MGLSRGNDRALAALVASDPAFMATLLADPTFIAQLNTRYAPAGFKTFQGVGGGFVNFAALTTVCTLVVPAQTMVGTLIVTADLRLNANLASDSWGIDLKNGAATLGTRQSSGTSYINISMTGRVATVAGVANTLTIAASRTGGTSTGTVFTEPVDLNRITALFVPG